MAIQIKSINQILGEMIRKIQSDTPLNDIHAGSVLLTLLEAAAANDFENNAAILNVLDLLNIDAIKNNDLDAKAADFGLARRSAIKASGLVDILNTNITKRTTGLYVIKPAPIAGQTKLFVNNANGWSPTGTLFIGRGTQSFEGPIAYTAITQYPTYAEISLASALQKDHLISDVVIDSQGEPDRLISAGTVVKIPANNQNPAILYVTLRDAVIPSGEDRVEDVEVLASTPGSQGNAGINTITDFESAPFSGAAVTNTSAFSNGRDVETDVELRNRLKSYSVTLARGTAPSIISAVIGVSDPDDSKQIASAVLTEPANIGDPSILYIDDGYGLQPSFSGQSVDTMLTDATGKEEFLQLANYPLPRPQVINAAIAPFNVVDGSFLRVVVDGEEETVYFSANQFLNSSAATVSEVIIAINDSSTGFKARFTDNSNYILLYPVNHAAETIQVVAQRESDIPSLYLNSQLKFPTNEFSYISLYQNNVRLREKSKSASLETSAFASWNITTSGNIIIAVDGTPAQDRSFAISDFPGASSFTSLTLEDWANAINNKFAGLTASVSPSQTIKIVSNKVGSASSLSVLGGSYIDKWFPNLPTYSVGQTAEFQLNRQTGNLRILNTINEGDTISAGIADARGLIISQATTSGTYNVAPDAFGRLSEMVVVVDSSACVQRSMTLLIGATISISIPSAATMRITSSTLDMFPSLIPGDYIYIVKRTSGWLSDANTGLFKIKAKGGHTVANVDSFIDVDNIGVVAEANISIADSLDIRGFATDGFPQMWRGSYVTNPASATISEIVASLNKDIIGVDASIHKSNSIKLASSTQLNGSIAIPISGANASTVFTETETEKLGNPPHIANRVSEKALMSNFKRSTPASSNVWLDRHTYSDIKGALSTNVAPDAPPFGSTYSEIIKSAALVPSNVGFSDYVSFTRGNNKGQLRTVKALIGIDEVGTQQGTARSEQDHIAGDEIQLVKPVEISSEDSIVFVVDRDPAVKTVDIRMARTGLVNSGSNMLSFPPTTTEFSANDADNESGIDFANPTTWGTSVNNTDFSDYAVWMKARNWYAAGGISSGLGQMLVRSAQYGPNGEKLRFAIEYPASANQQPSTSFVNTPSYSLLNYIYGSGPAAPIALSAGYTIQVKGPYVDSSTNFPNGATGSGNYFDYTFSGGNFATVNVGDVLSIITGSGVSNSNKGQFCIANKSGLTLRVFNPNASNTTPGAPEVTTVTTIADVVGTPTVFNITTVADVAGSLHLKYFKIYDTQGSVAVWFDVGNTGAPPPPHGANRAIVVANITANDTASVVATKIGTVVQSDNAFTVGVIGNQVTITNKNNGALASATANTSGFTVSTTTGTNDNSVNGKYFTIYDADDSVAVWFDVDARGTAEPFHGALRSIKVDGVSSGDSAATVAAAIVAAVNPDISFAASNLSNVVTITNASNGNAADADAATSGFTVASTNGSLPGDEYISNVNNISIFPLSGKDVATIASTVNDLSILELVPVGNSALEIPKATREDDYSYGGNSTALAYNHNPSNSSLNSFISLYDGVNWVKSFQNANPNFTFKKIFTLNGVAPAIYAMHSCPNYNTTDIGEFFKLIPTTVKNIHHHLTQKALSQLPIVADIAISNDRKNVQIISKNLGSAGSIEIVGGNANKAQAFLETEAEVSSDVNGSTLLVKVPAYPDTFNVNDSVIISNEAGVKRLSRLSINDSISVTNPSAGIIEYNFDPKTINVTGTTAFTITDVSASHSRPAGFVWRWTHDGSATFSEVRAGDLLYAFGPTLSWAQGNKARIAGDGNIAGLPIIAVNDIANYIDVVNPYGKAMTSTAVGVGNTVQVCPTPVIKWNLAHAARTSILSIVSNGTTVTVVTNSPHLLNSGDSINISDSNNIADGVYASVTVVNGNSFTFALVGPSFSESNVGASVIRSGLVPTRYRVEKLGFGDLIRISRLDGESPRFADCGVAVDDYVSIGGTTFSANNGGLFRAVAVDNDSIIVINSQGSDELDTLRRFNNNSLQPTWTSNTNVVTGAAGTFKNVNVGDWVKQSEDPDTYYRQVSSMSPGTPALATQITLGGVYLGSSSIAPGVKYDQLNDHDKGVILQNVEDIAVYEGDAAQVGDTLSVQNIVDANWFSVNNIGTFNIVEIGTNSTTLKPFIRINNSAGSAEANRLMSVDVSGVYITESLANKFYSIRQIAHAVIDDVSDTRRSMYLTPSNRSYKFSDTNQTSISHLGKLGYNTDVTSGVDGYIYYTGILRRAQRIVDGYEPDIENFPGRRAIGGLIEILPPLVKRIKVSINVSTNEGVNLGDITNNIKSTIINYVQGLGVGEDVIISEMIASIMQIKGVAAVTFTNPTPNTERVTIANNERANITSDDIGIS